MSTGSVVIFVCMVPIHSTVAAARSTALTMETICCLTSMWKVPPQFTKQEGSSALRNPKPEEFHSANETISELAQSDRSHVDAAPHQEELIISRSAVFQLEIPYSSFLSHPYPLIMKKCSCESSIVKCEVPINNKDHP